MLEESSKWILPENLDKVFKNNSWKIIDKGNNKNDHGGDFGAYYAFRNGINSELIKVHDILMTKMSYIC